jgi:hypothetical protein
VPRSGAHDVPLLRPFEASADTIKATTEELHSITAWCALSNNAAQLHPDPSSSREALPNVIFQDIGEGPKGGKKRRKQHRQESSTTAGDDSGINKQEGSSTVVLIVAVAGSGKCRA